jgi:hypothetical protein
LKRFFGCLYGISGIMFLILQRPKLWGAAMETFMFGVLRSLWW